MGGLRRIGVLGGMGPQATVLLQQRLIDAVKAEDDADHIPLLIDMNPQVPSRLEWILEGTGEDPGAELARMARGLQDTGAEAMVMPCNTAHHFAPDIRAAIGVPFLHMVDLACAVLVGIAGEGGRVGVLASPASERIGLFDKAFAPHGLQPIYPDDREALISAIRTIKSGGNLGAARSILSDAAAECARRGADCLLVGCSEFSIIADAAAGTVPVVDSLDVLVDEICAFAGVSGAAVRPS